MHYTKLLIVIVTILSMVFVLCAPCFSAEVAIIEAVDAFGAIYSAYLVARGLDPIVSANGILSDGTSPLPVSSWRDLWEQNWDIYGSLIDENTTDLVSWAEGYLAGLSASKKNSNGSSPSPSPDPNDNGIIGLQFSAELIEFFDKITCNILNDKFDLSYDVNAGGFVHSSGTFDSPLSTIISNFAPIVPNLGQITSGNRVQVVRNGLYVGYDSHMTYYMSTYSNSDPVYCFRIGEILYTASLSDHNIYIVGDYNGSYSGFALPYTGNYENLFVYRYNGFNGITWIVPEYQSLSEIANYINEPSSNEALLLRPSDKLGSPVIKVPNTSSPSYTPTPLEIALNAPWPSLSDQPDFSDMADIGAKAIIDSIIGEAVENELDTDEQINSDNPSIEAPTSVMAPFLPVVPPSFNFNLSGIWYYVVRWVNSIRTGVSLIFSVLGLLPAAMFFPVYGSAVVVIVVGIWKRFFT